MSQVCTRHDAFEVEFVNLNRRMERVEEVADIVIELKTVVSGLNTTLGKVNENMTSINKELIQVSQATIDHNRRLENLEQQSKQIIENDNLSISALIKDLLIKTVLPAILVYLLAKNGIF